MRQPLVSAVIIAPSTAVTRSTMHDHQRTFGTHVATRSRRPTLALRLVPKEKIAMHRAYFPLLLTATPAVRKLLGADLPGVATLAVQAILKHRRGIEVAH